MIEVFLKTNHDKPARQFHPWLYSGAVDRVSGRPEPGEQVCVRDYHNQFIAYGYINPVSQIQVRLLEWDEKQYPDDRWWHVKIEQAVNNRKMLLSNPAETDAGRLVFGESDFLPGLIVDKYAKYLVVQILTAGAERVKNVILDSLMNLIKPAGIYERSDVELRTLEGLEKFKGLVAGQEPPDRVLIKENDLRFMVDIKNGQKTGFYLDQRDNRRLAGIYAEGREILDGFGYTGAFSVYFQRGGAKAVTLLDSSSGSLQFARENIALNGYDAKGMVFLEGDAFTRLRELYETGRRYDLVVLDPPKFAFSKSHVKKALAAYKDINLQAMKLLRSGGILAAFSCSGAISWESFKMTIFWASVDAGRRIQYLHRLSHPPDHPVLASFPEGEYLKGCICRLD